MERLKSLMTEIWASRPLDLDVNRNHWDNRASEFNQHGRNERVNQVVEMLISKGALGSGKKVLDIGCGTGRYALAFAEAGAEVVGIDISENMIAYANENVQEMKENKPQFSVVAWEELDIKSKGWEGSFDLVTAIMTPAISSKKEIDKMLQASSRYGLMSTHIDRHERVMEHLEKVILGRTPKKHEFGFNLYFSFNTLWQYGIYPEMTYYQMERDIERTLEEAILYYSLQLEHREPLTASEKAQIETYLSEIAVEGNVKDNFTSKTGWLFWENKKEVR
jgi:SAM-dependent methyltransferase